MSPLSSWSLIAAAVVFVGACLYLDHLIRSRND